MYICYIDESGHCGEKYNPEQPIEVLFGAMLDLTKLTKAQRQHQEIMNIFTSHNINISEFKACDMYRGVNQFNDFSPDLRDTLFEFLLAWGEDRKCRYFISPIHSKKHFDLCKKNDPIAMKLKFPFEAAALNITLSIQKYQKSKKKNKGRTFVVFDEQHKHDENFIKLFEEQMNYTDLFTQFEESDGERLNQIIDIPFFSKSHLVTLIQLADVGAFITRKYYEIKILAINEKYDGELSKIEKWYKRICLRKVSKSIMTPAINEPLCKYYFSIRP